MTLNDIKKIASCDDSVRWDSNNPDYIVVNNGYIISIFRDEDNLYGVNWRITAKHRVIHDMDNDYEVYRANTIRKLRWLIKKLKSL